MKAQDPEERIKKLKDIVEKKNKDLESANKEIEELKKSEDRSQ